jgi:hypothetical protein
MPISTSEVLVAESTFAPRATIVDAPSLVAAAMNDALSQFSRDVASKLEVRL